MSTKSVLLVVVALVLGSVYAYWFTDWFRPGDIQILVQARPSNRNGRLITPGQVLPVSFAFERKFLLTEVRVVSIEEEKTSKRPHAVWHLISDSNSVPTKSLIYGDPVRGMKPKIPRAKPEMLQPDVPYRLYVKAGSKWSGHADFKTKATVPME